MAIPINDYLTKLPKERWDAIQRRTKELAKQLNVKQEQETLTPDSGLGLIGALQDDAEMLDEIVEDAMRRRQVSAWLPNKEDFAAMLAMAEETGRPLHDLLDEALRLLLRQRPPKQPMTEQEFLQHMLNIGLIIQLPDTASDSDDPNDQPIDIEGEPLSETIIRERR